MCLCVDYKGGIWVMLDIISRALNNELISWPPEEADGTMLCRLSY